MGLSSINPSMGLSGHEFKTHQTPQCHVFSLTKKCFILESYMFMLRDFINTDKRCLKKTHPIKNTKFKFSIV